MMIFRHGVAVRFMEFSRLLSLLKEGYSEGRSDAPVLTELAEVEVLAIDELGKGRLSDWELTIIDEVVSRRYNAMGCTLATTNYVPGNPTGAAPPNLSTTQTSGQTLGDRVGDRVYSRLLHLPLRDLELARVLVLEAVRLMLLMTNAAERLALVGPARCDESPLVPWLMDRHREEAQGACQ